MPCEAIDHRGLVGQMIVLADHDLVFRAVPAARPVLIGPHQAERHVQGRIGQQRLQGFFQQAAAVEPVEIEHEAMQPGAPRQVDLAAQRRGMGQVVMAQVARDPRLVVAGIARQAARHVRPFGEAGAPPQIVLRDRVELGQVIRQHHGAPFQFGGQRPHRLEIPSRPDMVAHRLRRGRIAAGAPGMQQAMGTIAQVMQQRVLRLVVLQIALAVVAHIEVRRGIARLAESLVQEVLERIDAGRRHVVIGRGVPGGIEFRQRADPAGAAMRQEMAQDAVAGLDPVQMPVPWQVEMEDRATAFRLAIADIVQQRILPGGPHVVILGQVPVWVEIRVRPAGLAPAMPAEMVQRIDAGHPHVRIGLHVPVIQEQPGLADRRPARLVRLVARIVHAPAAADRATTHPDTHATCRHTSHGYRMAHHRTTCTGSVAEPAAG